MEISTQKTYQELVNEAKVLLTRTSLIKMKIAKLALQACTIRHGGRSGNLYTLSKFATDVGVSRKQLSNWCLTYKNVVHHIEDVVLKEEDWISACRVHALITSENTRLRAERNIKSTKTILYLPTKDQLLELMTKVQKDSSMAIIKCQEYVGRAHFHLDVSIKEDIKIENNLPIILTHIYEIQKTCEDMLRLINKEKEQ